jgi:Icc-related predicted phosphoesterase
VVKREIIIDCISDLHGCKPVLQGGDLLIVAGDLTARDTEKQHAEFDEWLDQQNYLKKIVISGNHDGFIQKKGYLQTYNDFKPAKYLEDTGVSWWGLKIWGSPWTPTFYDWHFMRDRGDPIKEKWDLIPDDTEILITHGPPFGIQDQVKYSSKAKEGKFAGCEELRSAIDHRLKKLKLHVFGHVHEGYGKVIVSGVTHVNASIMDEEYRPVNKPIRIEL